MFLRYFPLRSLLICVGILYSSLIIGSSESCAVSATSSSKALTHQLSVIEKNLTSLQKTLETVKKQTEKTCTVTPENKPLARLYLASLIHFFQEKGEELREGGESLWHHAFYLANWRMPWEEWMIWGQILLKFMIALSIGWIGQGLATRLIKKPFRAFLRWHRRVFDTHLRLRDITEVIGEVFVFSIPLMVAALLQIGVFFFVEQNPILRNGMVSLVTGLLIWGGVRQLQSFVFSQPKKTFLLCYISANTQKLLLRKVYLLLFCVIFGGWVGELVTFLGLPQSAQKILMIIFGLGVVTAFFGITQILKTPILKTLATHNFKTFSSLISLWTGLWNSFGVLFYLLFVLDEQLLDTFFWPIIMTICFLPSVPLLYQGLRKLRLSYLWKHRHAHPSTALYNFLRPTQQMNRLSCWFSYGTVLFCIVEMWEFHLMLWVRQIIGDKLFNQICDVLLLLLVAWVILSVGDRSLRYFFEKSPSKNNTIEDAYFQGRLKTLLRIARILLRIAIWVSFSLLILSTMGYDINGIITSLSIVSAALAFGVQSLIKDFVTGFFILLDNSLMVGDQVEIDGKAGTVEDLSLRTLKIRSDNGTLQTIPFGSITVIGNKSRYFAYTLISLSVNYDEDPDKIASVLEKAYQLTRNLPTCQKKILAPIEVRGISDVSDYAIVFQARLKTAPGQQDFIKRAYTKVLKKLCDEAGIRVPSPPYPIDRTGKKPSLTNTT